MSSYKDRDIARARRKKAYSYLVDKGMAPHLAAGVVGNLMQESYKSLRSDAVNPNGGAVGIAQWLGKRQVDLKNFAKSPMPRLMKLCWVGMRLTYRPACNS